MSDTKGLSLKNCGSVPWYDDPEGNESPIGSMLKSVTIDAGVPSESPSVTIQVKLLGKMRDGEVELTYRGVRSYAIDGFALSDQLGNTWTGDSMELRRTDALKHKVTLTGGSWSIEADDIDYEWNPL